MTKRLKNQILENLTDWCLDPLGDLVKADLLKDKVYKDENAYWFRLYQDDESNNNWRTEPQIDDIVLEPRYYQEIKKAMIEEIKQSPQDWKIEREMKFTILRNNKTGRKLWKSDFSEGFKKGFKPEEWREIENALNNEIPIREQRNEINTPPQNYNTRARQGQQNRSQLFAKAIFISLLASILLASFWWIKKYRKWTKNR